MKSNYQAGVLDAETDKHRFPGKHDWIEMGMESVKPRLEGESLILMFIWLRLWECVTISPWCWAPNVYASFICRLTASVSVGWLLPTINGPQAKP